MIDFHTSHTLHRLLHVQCYDSQKQCNPYLLEIIVHSFLSFFHEKKLRIYLYNTRQYLLLTNKIQMVIHRPIS